MWCFVFLKQWSYYNLKVKATVWKRLQRSDTIKREAEGMRSIPALRLHQSGSPEFCVKFSCVVFKKPEDNASFIQKRPKTFTKAARLGCLGVSCQSVVLTSESILAFYYTKIKSPLSKWLCVAADKHLLKVSSHISHTFSVSRLSRPLLKLKLLKL